MTVARHRGRPRLGCSPWSAGSSASRTSTASPARCGASAGSAPTRSPATCSAGSCRWGRSSNVFLANGARLYLDVGSPPRVRHPGVRLDPRPRHPRQGGGADPRAAPRLGRAAPPRGGHPRRHLPLQEQHRLGRQQLRLPRELPHAPARRLRPLRRGAHPVPRVAGRSTPAPARCCRRPAARCTASPSGPSTSGRACRSATTRSRPIINTRDEPHADAERYRRLHVIVGDSNMSEYATFLKVGATVDPAAHARGPAAGAARHDAREPDPGHPRDQPRHHLPAQGAPGQRARAVGASTSRASTSPGRCATPRPKDLLAAGEAGPADVGALRHRHRERPAGARPRVRLGDQAQAHRGLPRQARPARSPTRRSR